MATRSLRLVVDTENGRLIPGFRSIISTINPKFTVGDQVPVEVYLCKASAQTGFTLQEVPFPAGCVLRVALGEINQVPTSGNWTLSFDGDTTADIPYNATAAQVQTALNALASITAAGGVVVSKVGDAYSVQFNTAGDQVPITGNAGTLVPLSAVSVQTLQEGTVSEKEVVFVQVKVRPIALTETFSDIGSPVISQTGQNYSISGPVKAGSYTLTFTVGASSATTVNIPFNASAAVIQAAILVALDSIGFDTGNQALPVQVIQNEAQSWSISYWDGGSYLTGVSGTNLVGFAGKTGTLSINTAEALAFIGSDSNKTATLEVEVEVSSQRQTLVQTNAAVSADVILAGAFEPSTLEDALSEAVANTRFIRRDADQTLDATTKDQIWENLLGSTATTGVNLVDAILAANAPNASNALATLADIPAPFDQSLNISDSVSFANVDAVSNGARFRASDQAAGQVTLYAGTGITFPDLSVQTTAAAAFDQALNTTDAVDFAGVTSTNGVIISGGVLSIQGGGGDTEYRYQEVFYNGTSVLTPTTLTLGDFFTSLVTLDATNGLTWPSGNILKDTAYTAGTVQHSGGGGHIDANDYPDEIQVVINGVTYAVPARAI